MGGGWLEFMNSSPESVIDNEGNKISTNLSEDSGGERRGRREERVK